MLETAIKEDFRKLLRINKKDDDYKEHERFSSSVSICTDNVL